jgi:hypothetical protein
MMWFSLSGNAIYVASDRLSEPYCKMLCIQWVRAICAGVKHLLKC